MGVRVYLDDLRSAPPGWVLVRDAEEFVDLLVREGGNVEAVSMDHDLGPDSLPGHWAAGQVLGLIMDRTCRGLWFIRIHTMNGVEAPKMAATFTSQNPHVTHALPDDVTVYVVPGGDSMQPGPVELPEREW